MKMQRKGGRRALKLVKHMAQWRQTQVQVKLTGLWNVHWKHIRRIYDEKWYFIAGYHTVRQKWTTKMHAQTDKCKESTQTVCPSRVTGPAQHTKPLLRNIAEYLCSYFLPTHTNTESLSLSAMKQTPLICSSNPAPSPKPAWVSPHSSDHGGSFTVL